MSKPIAKATSAIKLEPVALERPERSLDDVRDGSGRRARSAYLTVMMAHMPFM